MRVHIYTGSLRLVQKSGVGQAILHQKEMLRQAGVETTERWDDGAGIIHLNTVLPDAPIAALLARFRGEKVVYYGHSTMEDFRQSFKGSNLLAPLFRRWIKFCYGLGDVVITPTVYSKTLIEGYGVKAPVVNLSNGVDTAFFAPDPGRRAAFRRRYGLKDGDRAVLSVGHWIARKGLVEFVELARRMPETRFFWFGATDLRLVPEDIRRAVETAPANAAFPGFVDREALRDAYCGCDVFAFMSREETEGIVVLEALSCGIPTVVRDIPVYRDWLTDGAEVYKADSDGAFEARVRGLLDGTLPSTAARGRVLADSRSLGVMGRRLRELYQRHGLVPSPIRHPAHVRTLSERVKAR